MKYYSISNVFIRMLFENWLNNGYQTNCIYQDQRSLYYGVWVNKNYWNSNTFENFTQDYTNQVEILPRLNIKDVKKNSDFIVFNGMLELKRIWLDRFINQLKNNQVSDLVVKEIFNRILEDYKKESELNYEKK